MMFWILFPCNLLTLSVMHFSIISSTEPNGSIIMGVNIPEEHHNNMNIHNIRKYFKKSCRVLFWSLFVFQFLLFPLRCYLSLSTLFVMIFILGTIGAYTRLFQESSRKLFQLKKENRWFLGEVSIQNIDTEVSRLKNTFPVSKWWFTPPILIFIFGIILSNKNNYLPWIAITAMGIILLSSMLLYKLFLHVRTVTYSEKTEINLTLNKVYKHEWSKAIIMLSYSSLFFVPLLFDIKYIRDHLVN